MCQVKNHVIEEEVHCSLLSLVLDLIPYVVFWKDRESVYLGCNRNFATLAGRASPNDIIGLTDHDLPWTREESDAYRADDAEVMTSGRAKLHIVETLLDAKGQRTWKDTSKVPLRDRHGNVIGVLGILADITELKERERELRRANEIAVAASTAKTNFMANLSHEIRTPMSAILGFTELLAKTAREDQASGLETIQRNANHLLELIDDILDLSKIEVGKLRIDREAVAPTALVRDVATLMSQRAVAKELHFELRLASQLPKAIDSDATRLRQILINLIGNALKFTASGGITVSVDAADGALRVVVEDTGMGISEGNLERIFEPFEQVDASATRRHGGAGLGLAISRRLARALGGDITVTSVLGQGSVFTLSHPLPPSIEWVDTTRGEENDLPIVRPARTTPDAGRSLRGKTVLLVEDGADNRMLFARFLESAGAKVRFATDGVEALDSVSEAERSRVTIDAILMDMQMPLLDGYEATRRLRERGCRIPILALTAHAMSGDRQRCTDAGCDDYLTKPVSGRHLLDDVAAWIERGATTRRVASG